VVETAPPELLAQGLARVGLFDRLGRLPPSTTMDAIASLAGRRPPMAIGDGDTGVTLVDGHGCARVIDALLSVPASNLEGARP
jgi:hypothetical protein